MNLVQAQLEDSIKNPYQFLNKKKVPETFVSQEIRVISEVEKIWILYDLDDNGTIDFDEMKLYIKETAFKSLKLSDEQLIEIYGTIDADGNGTIDRDEMAQFLKLLIDMQDEALKQKRRRERSNSNTKFKKLNLVGRELRNNIYHKEIQAKLKI